MRNLFSLFEQLKAALNRSKNKYGKDNSVEKELDEMDGFSAPSRYDRYLKPILLVLIFLSPILAVLWIKACG